MYYTVKHSPDYQYSLEDKAPLHLNTVKERETLKKTGNRADDDDDDDDDDDSFLSYGIEVILVFVTSTYICVIRLISIQII